MRRYGGILSVHYYVKSENATYCLILTIWQGFPGGSVVKNPHAKQETLARSLGQKDTLRKEMATHSSILACEISWTEETGGLQSMGLQKRQTWLSD